MKTLYIVGGSHGIGYETVKRFARDNYKIINTSRTECDIGGVQNYLCDITDRAALDGVLSQVTAEASLDCFVYSAGFSMASPLECVEEGDYRYLFEVNFFAFLHCLKTLLPLLGKSRGTVIAVSSIGAVQPIPYDAYYSSSKAALNVFISALCYELEQTGITAVSIMPGGTKTDFTYRRKIYPYESIGKYAKTMFTSVENLEKIEQGGMQPDKVADSIYKICVSAKPGVYSSGFVNKCAHLLTRILPQKLLFALGKFTFFSEETDQE
jgi:short-subunit dehydrogenase